MKKLDLLFIFLFFLSIILVFFTLYNINNFMKLNKQCENNFEVINKCACIPPNWENPKFADKIKCADADFFGNQTLTIVERDLNINWSAIN
jgi:hypothetical protein